MIKYLNTRSLSFQLSLILSGMLVVFWVLTTTLAVLHDFYSTRSLLIERLEHHARDRVNARDDELASIANDMFTLLNKWQHLSPHFPVGSPNRFLAARYIHWGGKPDSADLVSRTQAFIEAYGHAGIGRFVEFFALLNSGIVISNANGQAQNSADQFEELRALQKRRPEKDGLVWGRPYHYQGNEWRISVGITDPVSGVFIGSTVKLTPPLNPTQSLVLKHVQSVWLDQEGQLFTRNLTGLSQEQLSTMSDCSTLSVQDMGTSYVICLRTAYLGWRLVLQYPSKYLTQKATKDLPLLLPAALIILLVLVAAVYLLLQRKLGRTLSNFVYTIRANSDMSTQRYLPTNRTDELGEIAQAYNHLLDAIHEQYAELEGKVDQRTAELVKARCYAEQCSANKSEQIASISHEIRTPLNGIVGALTLLEHTPCDKPQQNLVYTALKCSDHLLEIINNLLDFSRIESGQMVVTPAEQDSLALLDQTMLTIQLPVHEKGLELHVEVAASFPLNLTTDALRLKQILINLLGNAVKFTREGSITLFAYSEGGHVCISVQDTGPGIPSDKRGDLFTPFHQLERHTVGSGLGLAIARSLARLLQGDLQLQETTGGAGFLLTLPLPACPRYIESADQPVVAPRSLHSQLRAWGYRPETGDNPTLDDPTLVYLPARLRQRLHPGQHATAVDTNSLLPLVGWSLNVLVVDDVATNRGIVSQMLQHLGQHTLAAASGEEALALGASHLFDLVLMDIWMPVLSGVDTLLRWRAENSHILDPDCPIIALTANAQPGERERLQALGFNEYLTKPLSLESLAQALGWAAQIQLERGFDLAINTNPTAPLLGAPHLQKQVNTDLCHYLHQLKAAAEHEPSTCLALLHTIKGLAGQAGLNRLWEAAKEWEIQLQQDDLNTTHGWETFLSLLESELEQRDNPKNGS